MASNLRSLKIILLTTVLLNVTKGAVITSTAGTEFVFSFIGHRTDRNNHVFINTFQESPDVTVNLNIPDASISESFTVSRSSPHHAEWPDRNDLHYIPIMITADAEVFVHAYSDTTPEMADGFCPIPISSLGTRHRLVSSQPVCSTAEFVIIALDEETEVSVSNLGIGLGGPVINETLSPRSAFKNIVGGLLDHTGVLVTSDNPVAVVSGVNCGTVPIIGDRIGKGGCELLIEQVPDIESYGRHFVLTTFWPRKSGFIYRVLASQDNTIVNITSLDHTYETQWINADEFYDGDVNHEFEMLTIVSSKPVLVVQYAKSRIPPYGLSDGISDPFMTLVPSIEHYSDDVIFSSTDAGGIYAKVSIASFCCDHDTILVDDVEIRDWTTNKLMEFTNGEMCVTHLNLGVGSFVQHTITHPGGAKFMAITYGTGIHFAYAYPLKYNVHVKLDPLIMSQSPSIKSEDDDNVVIEWQSWGSSESDTGDGPVAEYHVFYHDTSAADDTWTFAGALEANIPCGTTSSIESFVTVTMHSYTVTLPSTPGRYEFSVSAVGRWDRVGPRSPASLTVDKPWPTTTTPPQTTTTPPPTTTTPPPKTTTPPPTTITPPQTTTTPPQTTITPPQTTQIEDETVAASTCPVCTCFQTTKAAVEATTLSTSVDIEMDGSLSIDRAYTHDLHNAESPEYQQLESEFVAAMDSALKDQYGGTQNFQIIVNGFRFGSVVVDYKVIFTEVVIEEEEEQQVLNDTREALLTVLTDAISDGNLGELEILPDSLAVSNAIINPVTTVPKAKLTTKEINALVSSGSVVGFFIIVIACCIICRCRNRRQSRRKPWYDISLNTDRRRSIITYPSDTRQETGSSSRISFQTLTRKSHAQMGDMVPAYGEYEIVGVSGNGGKVRGTIRICPPFNADPAQNPPAEPNQILHITNEAGSARYDAPNYSVQMEVNKWI